MGNGTLGTPTQILLVEYFNMNIYDLQKSQGPIRYNFLLIRLKIKRKLYLTVDVIIIYTFTTKFHSYVKFITY